MRRTRTLLFVALASSLAACADTHLVPVDPDGGVTPARDAGPVACALATDDSPWSPTGGPLGGSIDALAFDGSSYLAASRRILFRASAIDGPWIAMPGAGDVGIRPTVAASPDGWFTVASGSVVRSTDGGLTWSATAGLAGARVSRLASSGGETVAIADLGVFTWSGSRWELAVEAPIGGLVEAVRTADGWLALSGGLQVLRSDSSGWVDADLSIIALDLAAIGALHFAIDTGGTVWRSSDRGVSWSSMGRISDSRAHSIVATQDGSIFVLGAGGRVWRATDAGFEAVPGFESDRVVARLTDPETCFVSDGERAFVFADGGRIGRSEAGTSIEERPSPIPAGAEALGCTGRECLAVGADLQLFRYTIDGESWEALGALNARAFGVSAVASIEGELWLGTHGDGVYALRDGEAIPVGAGIPGFNGSAGPQTFPVTGLAHFRGATFAATSGAGVYRLVDGDAEWLPINGGIPVVSLGEFGRPMRAGLSALVAQGHVVTGGESPFWLDAESGRWEPASSPSGDAIVALAASESGVFALSRLESGSTRVLRSEDGRLFEPVPIPSEAPAGIAALGGELWLTGADGVWRSRDRGDAWERVEGGLDGATPGALVATESALWLSTDRGVYSKPVACEVER